MGNRWEKWRRTRKQNFHKTQHDENCTKIAKQRSSSSDILSTPVTRTSSPLAIIHHCPKITTGNSFALSIRPARQGNPLLFPQQTTQLSFYETGILVRMSASHPFSLSENWLRVCPDSYPQKLNLYLRHHFTVGSWRKNSTLQVTNISSASRWFLFSFLPCSRQFHTFYLYSNQLWITFNLTCWFCCRPASLFPVKTNWRSGTARCEKGEWLCKCRKRERGAARVTKMEIKWLFVSTTQLQLWLHSSERVGGRGTLRASLSGTFLQTLPDLVTPLKGPSLSPRSCPPTRSAPSERFEYW